MGQYVGAVWRAVGRQTLGAASASLREGEGSRVSVVQPREDDEREGAENVGDSNVGELLQLAVSSNKDTKDMGRNKLHPC